MSPKTTFIKENIFTNLTIAFFFIVIYLTIMLDFSNYSLNISINVVVMLNSFIFLIIHQFESLVIMLAAFELY